MSHTWPFFNSQFPTAENGTGADHVELYKSSGGLTGSPNSSSLNLTSKEAKRLSLQVNQSRSFGKGDTPGGGPSVAQKGYRTFNPGEYMYNFELPLDSHLPETIDVDLGSVKYELEATVERAGAFRTNLVGTKEVILIRAPSEGSLEQVEPIAISRSWEDQLHYDIVISGKSFPLGAQVPIAFKLTPLAKVQCHRIKVYVTENVEYFCNNKRVHRMEPVRKVQLFEKRADGPPTSTFPGSTMRIVSGGGVPYDQRAAASRGEDVSVEDPTNLLGDLSTDGNIGPTEMEFNVQLPSCHNLREKDKSSRLHFDTTYQNIQVHHWIKVCSQSCVCLTIHTNSFSSSSSCAFQSQMQTIRRSDDTLKSRLTRPSISFRVKLRKPTQHYRLTRHPSLWSAEREYLNADVPTHHLVVHLRQALYQRWAAWADQEATRNHHYRWQWQESPDRKQHISVDRTTLPYHGRYISCACPRSTHQRFRKSSRRRH